MSVWNRPMFAGARPPNSARAELERLRVGMADGGRVFREGDSALSLPTFASAEAEEAFFAERFPAEEAPSPFGAFWSSPIVGARPPEARPIDHAEEERARRSAARQIALSIGSPFDVLDPEGMHLWERPLDHMNDEDIRRLGFRDRDEIRELKRFYQDNFEEITDFLASRPEALEAAKEVVPRQTFPTYERPFWGRLRSGFGLSGVEMGYPEGTFNVEGLRSLMAAVRGEDQPGATQPRPRAERTSGTSDFRDIGERRDPPPLEGRAAFKDAHQRRDFEDVVEPPPSPGEPPPFAFDPRLQPFGMSQTEITDFLRERYTAREALYDEILGDPERRRAQARSEIFFEIAQRALQFAGGVGPDGRPMSGSMFAQAAQSFAPVFGSLAERSRELTDQERALRASRLDAAEGDLAREQGLRAEITRDQVRSLIEGMGAGEGFPLLNAEEHMPTEESVQQLLATMPDMRDAYSAASPILTLFNTVGAIAGMQPAPETGKATVAAEFIRNRLLGDLARNLQDSGKVSNFALELSQRLLVESATWSGSVQKAIDSYTQIEAALEADIREAVEEYNNAVRFNIPRVAMEARNRLGRLQRSHAEVSAVRLSLQGQNPVGGQMDLSDLANRID